jgi:isoquinoline 1-oxidoreductase beta subunit
MPIDKIVVNVLFLGGGFGRKSKGDFAIEAAILSRAMGGRPVKVTFTREDDLQNDFFHTVSVERLEAGLDANGKPVAWLHRTVAPTILSTFAPDQKRGAVRARHGRGRHALRHPQPQVRTRKRYAHQIAGCAPFQHPARLRRPELRRRVAARSGATPGDYLLELIGPDRS